MASLAIAAGCAATTPSPSASAPPSALSQAPTVSPAPTPVATPAPSLAAAIAGQLILFRTNNPALIESGSDTWAVARADGTARTTIGDAIDARWSPDGTRIYLMRAAADCTTQIVSVRPDGSDSQLLPFGLKIGDGPFWWAPDGQHVAFIRLHDEFQACRRPSAGLSWDVWVMDADGGHQHKLAGGWAAWSPDGAHLALLAASGSSSPWDGLSVVDATGVVMTTIGTPGAAYETPVWSPDGSRLAFGRYDPSAGSWQAVVRPAADLSQADIAVLGSPGAELFGDGAWSPDGVRLIFRAPSSDLQRTELFIQAADGSGPAVPLTPPGADEHEASWSASGQAIAVARNDAYPGQVADEIMVVDPGSGAVLSNLGPGDAPRWQPG